MPAVAQSLSVFYGGTSIGGSTNFPVVDYWNLDVAYGVATFEANVLVARATEALFIADCQALEAAFSAPLGRLQVTLGATSHLDLDPAAGAGTNTGFNARATCRKTGDERFDSARSRLYRVRVEVALPADAAGHAARDWEVTRLAVRASPSGRRTIELRGRYTASGATNARAQYQAQIVAFETSVVNGVEAGLFASSELVAQDFTIDDQDKSCEFARVRRELLVNQSTAGLDHATIVEQRLDIRRERAQPGASVGPYGEPRELATFVVSYSAAIDKGTTTLRAFYNSTIRPWLLQHASDVMGMGSVALVAESFQPDRVENTVSASLTLQARDGTSLLRYAVTVDEDQDFGVVLTPVWSENPLERIENQGPGRRVRTTTTVRRSLASSAGGAGGAGGSGDPLGGFGVGAFRFFLDDNFFAGTTLFGRGARGQFVFVERQPGLASAGAGGQGAAGGAGASGWRAISRRGSRTPQRLGLDGRTLDVIDETTALVEEWVVPVGAGGDAGGRTGQTRFPGLRR